MNTTLSDSVSFRRIAHAAHYMGTERPGYSGPVGHDIEEWDIVAPTGLTYDEKIAAGIPGDAAFHVGYFDKAGNHHWTYTRRAPLSESAACSHCRLRR